MKGKILFVAGLGVGYVLGTRAGRERYEQISRAASSLWNTDTVQRGVGTVSDFAKSSIGDLGEKANQMVRGVVHNATKPQETAPAKATTPAARRAAGKADAAASAARSSKSSASKPAASKSSSAKSGAAKSGSSKSTASKSSNSKSGGAKSTRATKSTKSSAPGADD